MRTYNTTKLPTPKENVNARDPKTAATFALDDLVALDIECHFDKNRNLQKYGVGAYLENPDTDVYLVAITGPDGPIYAGDPENAPWHCLHAKTVVAHNAAFDKAAHTELQARGIAPLNLQPADWLDTAAMAAYFKAPRDLRGAADVLLGQEISKDYRKIAKGKYWDEFTAEEKQLLTEACISDAHAAFRIASEYHHRFPEHERALSGLHMKHTERGLRVDQTGIGNGIQKLTLHREHLEAQLPWIKQGEKPTSVKAIKNHCVECGITPPDSFSKSDPSYLAWESEHAESHPEFKALREWRECNGHLKRLDSLKNRIRLDGRIPCDLKYHGTSTGRASGSGGLNLQGLPNGAYQGVDIRSLIIPEVDHKFVVADLEQIEPRCTAMQLNDSKVMDQVQQGVNIYEAHARTYLGWQGGVLKHEDPNLYKLAKICVLSLTYGTGYERFQQACNAAGIVMSTLEAQELVCRYRDQQPILIGQWKSLAQRFKAHAGNPDPFEIELPSGRSLQYFDCTYRPKDTSYVARPVRGKPYQRFWGSKLFENSIQAVARDIFMGQLLAMENRGLKTVLHIHDEVVVECPKRDVAAVEATIKEIMTTPPDWLPDLPLACEVKICNQFN